MISFRYHVVSVVAVFLALGLGVIAGTTVLDQGLVSRLESGTTEAKQRASQAQQDARELRKQLEPFQGFASAALPYLIEDRLLGREVVVITQDDADPAARDDALTSLQAAGATVVVLSVTSKVTATDPATETALAEAIHVSPPASSPELARMAASALANRLALGVPAPPSDRPQGDDILGNLLSGGFLAPVSSISPGDLPSIGGPGQAVVVVSGTSGRPIVPMGQFMEPLIGGLASHDGAKVAVAEARDVRRYSVVRLLRRNALVVRDPVVTVDDLGDGAFGGAALVLGLDQLLRDGNGGDYGVEDGADGILPAL